MSKHAVTLKGCAICGKEIPYTQKHPAFYRKVKYCSTACAHLKPRNNPRYKKANLFKNCIVCGKTFGRSVRPSGKWETLVGFEKRQHCSHDCAWVSRTGIEKISNPKRKSVHARARKLFRKDSCERCSAAEVLCVHHKDRNPWNNVPENVETLCRACHCKEHIEELLAARGVL